MKSTTIDLGYIELSISIICAKHGANVTGEDINEDVVKSLNNRILHLEEPFLDEALKEVIEAGTFKASLKPEKADCFIITVPTPNNDDQYKSCDIGDVMSACESILPYVEKGNVVIVESTIAPRTMDDHVKPFFEEKGFIIGEDLFLVHCPERVLPGQIMHELIHNNRIIGGITPACTNKAKEVYAVFVQGEMTETNAKTAEMSKLMENTYRDPYFIIAKSPENSPLIQNSRSINNSMPEFVVDKVRTVVEKTDAKKISVFGLTYKGNVDDIRESPAMDIYHTLQKEFNINIVAHDPHVKKSFVEEDVEKAVEGSSLLLVLSDHNEFKDLDNVAELMKDNIILDTKNIVSTHNNYRYFNMGNLYNLKYLFKNGDLIDS